MYVIILNQIFKQFFLQLNFMPNLTFLNFYFNLTFSLNDKIPLLLEDLNLNLYSQ
jgi:hypothetical protein